MTELNVAVLGGGSWGTTVAALVTRNAPVTLWARNPETVAEINTRHTNSVYLPDAKLPEKLTATTDIGEAVRGGVLDLAARGVPAVPAHVPPGGPAAAAPPRRGPRAARLSRQ